MKPIIVTIGVYGFNEQSFFQALQDAQIDTLCDIRARRGVRGAEYAFANSERLQRRLAELRIRYVYLKQLAPPQEVRRLQKQEDKQTKTAKRQRGTLGETFQQAYRQTCLAELDRTRLFRQIGEEARTIALLCVERTPEACHRSLVAEWLGQELGLTVKHILP